MGATFDKLLGQVLLHSHKDSDLSDYTVLDARYVNVTGDSMTGSLNITVPTATNTGLVLKTSDDNTTNYLLDIQSSTSSSKVNIDSLGTIYQNATAYYDYQAFGSFGGTSTLDDVYGSLYFVYHNILASNTFSETRALAGTANIASNNNAYDYGTVWGLDFSVYHTGTGTIDTAYGITATVSMQRNSAKITNAYGIKVSVGSSNTFTSVSLTTGYGLYIQNRTGGTSSTYGTYYGIYLANTTGTGTLTNNYGLYIPVWNKGGTLNYSIYTNTGLVHIGDALEIVGNITPTTDSARTLGSSSLYWSQGYIDKLFLNATATIDGASAGLLQITGKVGIGKSPTVAFDVLSGDNTPFILQKTSSTGLSISSYWPTLALNMYHNGTQWVVLGTGYLGSWNINPTTGMMIFGVSTASQTGGAGVGSSPTQTELSVGPTEVIVNDGGISTVDFRAEGDTNANMIFLDSSADAIMFGTGTLVTNSKITLGLEVGITDAKNIILGTTTGTKIGTATTQKLGFWNVTPVVQQATNAYTSDGEGVAYTGIDNAQAGTVYATVADLNQLRVAYETLRASYDDLLTKLKNTGIVA